MKRSSSTYKIKLTFIFFIIFAVPLSLFVLSQSAKIQNVDPVATTGVTLDRTLESEVLQTNLMASNSIFWAINNWGLEATGNQISLILNQAIQNAPSSQLILFVDMNGIVQAVNNVDGQGTVLQSQGLIGQNFSSYAWFNQVLENGQTVVGQPAALPFLDAIYGIEGTSSITIAAPIFGPIGEQIGTLVRYINFGSVLAPLTESFESLRHQGFNLIQFSINDANGKNLMTYGDIEQGTAVTLRNFEGSVMPETVNWTLEISEKPSLISTFLSMPQYVMLSIVLAGVMVIFAISYLLADNVMTPIYTLIHACQSRAGKLPFHDRQDEYGHLSRAISMYAPQAAPAAYTPAADQTPDEDFITTDSVAPAPLEMGDAAERLENIAEFINNLTVQANMLALNASMRASNAEEAQSCLNDIVAEANTLAENSKRSSDEIADTIQRIQGSMTGTIHTEEERTPQFTFS